MDCWYAYSIGAPTGAGRISREKHYHPFLFSGNPIFIANGNGPQCCVPKVSTPEKWNEVRRRLEVLKAQLKTALAEVQAANKKVTVETNAKQNTGETFALVHV